MYIRSFVACLALSLLGVGSLFADDEQLQVTESLHLQERLTLQTNTNN